MSAAAILACRAMPQPKRDAPAGANGQPLPALGGAHLPGVKTLRPISRRLCEVATEARSLPLSERLITAVAADVEPKHTGVIIKLLNGKGWFTEEVCQKAEHQSLGGELMRTSRNLSHLTMHRTN